MRKLFLVAVVALVPGLAAAARSGDDLGDRGVISPSGSASLSYSKDDDSSSGQSGASMTSATLAPGVLYFVIDDLAVGGSILLASRKPGSGSATTSVGIGPQVAYHLRFNERWSLLPSLALDLTRTSGPDTFGVMTTLVTFAPSLYVPVLLRTGQFYMGFGPFLSRELYAHATSGGSGFAAVKNTSVGVSTTLGGWL